MNSEDRNKTLYYFTLNYPFGNSPLWKKNELEVLSRYFRRIVVIPLTYGEDDKARNLVEGVEYESPIIDANHSGAERSVVEKIGIMAKLLRSQVWRHFIREFLSPNVLSSPSRLKEMLRSTYEIGLFHGNTRLKEIFDSMTKDDSVACFYWGIGQVNALLLRRPEELPFSACRFHGWDLYEERHESGYIPYRGQLVKILDLLLPCSVHGAEYLKARYGPLESKILTARLGTKSVGRSPMNANGVLKIVSCSSVVEVKRLDLLCEALMTSTIPIRWTHIGDGELMPQVRSYVERFPPNVEADLRGAIQGSEVSKTLAGDSFDLFVNTSRSEGVPVSIMEAFAAGIPAYATDVGGTGEIVDDTVGKLIPSSVTARELAGLLEGFSFLDEATLSEMRDNAFRRFQEMCDAEANAERLANVLVNEGRIDI